MQFGYRTSALRDGSLKGAFVVSATLQLERGDGNQAKQLMAKLTREPTETQPIKTKNCARAFKNPPGDTAGRRDRGTGLAGGPVRGAGVPPLPRNAIACAS